MESQQLDHLARRRLIREIQRVAERFRQRRLWRGLAGVAALGLVVAVAGVIGILQGVMTHVVLWTAAGALLAVAVAVAIWAQSSFRRPESLVRAIEDSHPELQQRLVTALDQVPQGAGGQLGYLQRSLLNETLEHARARKWERMVPAASIDRSRAMFALLAFGWLLATVATFAIPTRPGVAASPDSEPKTAANNQDYQLTVAPGDVEVERGSHLTVTARFAGRVPVRTELVMDTLDGERVVGMARSLDDPLFGAHVREVQQPMTYRVRYDDGLSDPFRVTVFEYPDLLRSDAILTFPQYTDLPTKEIENVRRVTAVEGTELAWICHLNKPVTVIQLVDEAGRITHFKPHPTLTNAYIADVTLTANTRWELQMVDDCDRHNKHDIHLSAKVLPNRPPELKLELARDVRVSPLEELPVKASVADDFGVRRLGVSYVMPGQQQAEVVLGESVKAKEYALVEHLIDFEALEAVPDQLLSYHFWAEDIGPDGQTRRVFSDMFFAEVRPFEEIFREGQQPTASEMARQQQQQQQQQGGANAQRADQLAELQKQIINATWNIVRRETGETPTEKFPEDLTLLIDSQNDAIGQLEELSAELTDAESTRIAESARTHMQQVVEQLTVVRDEQRPGELMGPLALEQAAYQDLLGLRAREHEVIRGQQQQQGQQSGSGSSGNRQQQQLNELELSNDLNRYETEQQAQAAQQQTETERELRQVLNRLEDLAKRQEDLNQRLQELQSALAEAETQQEREEIERQLKRLRDQQEELLRDTDELAERMNQQTPSEAQQNSQQQLDETRENVRRSAEALSQQNIAEALSAGTRAERQFEEMREEIRRQTSNQFAEGVRDMRQQARELEQQQEEVQQQLESMQDNSANQLRDTESRQSLEEALQDQRQRLAQLLEQMQQTVLDAEESEPLLAEQLYETHRAAGENELDRRLETLEQLVDRGLLEPTTELNQATRQGISQLREGIEQAAESVLGDETEALRRAADELERLARQLDDEIRRATGQSDQEQGEQQEGEQQEGGQQQGGQQQGEQQEGGQQEGGQQEGGQQEGEQQQGGQQQGGQQQGGQQQGGQQQGGQQQGGQQQGEQQQGEQQEGGQQEGGQQEGGQQEGEQQQGGQQQGGQQQGEQQQGGQQQGGQQQGGQQQGEQQGGQQQGEQQGGQQQGGQQQGGQQQGGEQQGGEQQEQPAQDGRQGSRQAQDGRSQQGGSDGNGTQDEQDRNDPSARDSRDGGGGLQRFAGESLGGAPLTGDGFRDWSDRLRDVEEMIDDPELQGEAARIRERARDMRLEWQRHSKEPEWPLVKRLVAQPLESLHQRVSEELLRRTGEQNARVPIDRDPVPRQYSDQVRRYYEQLGGSR